MAVMHFQTSQRKTIDIGDGLIMRWSTKADTENVANLVGDSFRWMPLGDPLPVDSVPPPNAYLKAGAKRTLSGKSTAMSEFDYALVEDTKREKGKNPIVACVSLHRCLAYYGSVDVHFGKPELIATNPEYRNRGFIRRLLLEMVHPESDARGDVLQFILGLQHFYRQFGYEYGLHYATSAKIESPDFVPALAKGKSEPYILRQATMVDIPFLTRLSTPEKTHANAQVGTYYTNDYWRYTVSSAIQDRQDRFDGDRDTRVIVEAESGKAVGFTVMSYIAFGPQLEIMALEEGEAAYIDVTNPVLRQLFAIGTARDKLVAKEREADLKKNLPAKAAVAGVEVATDVITATAMAADATTNTATAQGSKPAKFRFSIRLNEKHPLRLLLGTNARRPPQHIPDFRIYTRIKSYPAFIMAVAPELEKRLANSALAGTTGRLQLNFFRQVEGSSGNGLEVLLEKGKIVDANDWTPLTPEKLFEQNQQWKKDGSEPVIYSATFAPLTFICLLTGHRSLEELHFAYGENNVRDEATRLLLNTLFPKAVHTFDLFY
ncbi:hypothetical protein BGZ58_005861 [Dissophora ornata]|nr:hypothetical protein BGZ58_005861 [Dissophora ornata]